MADDIKLVVGVDYTELTGLVRTTNQTKTALGSMAKSFAQTGNQKQYMRGINQLVAAQKNLDKSSRMSRAEIMKLGNQMRQQAKFAQALTNATTGAATAQMAATKSSNRMGVVTQQAGYQVSDFIVQVQSGTNAFVAFGQQASQLVGVLPLVAGPLGLTASAAVGLSAGLGIAIPLVTAIGAALSRTSKDAEEAKNEIDSLADSLDKFELAQKALRAGMTVGQFTLVEQLKDLDQQIDKTKQKITDLQSGKGGQTQLGAIYEAGGLQEDIKADQEKILKLEELRDRVLSRISVKFENQKNSLEDQNEIQRAINKYGEDSKKVQDIRNRQALIALDISAKTKGFSVQQRIELMNLLKAQQDLEQAARVSLKLAEQEEASTKRSVDLHEKLADTRSKEAKDRQKAVQKILDTANKEYYLINDKLRLLNIEEEHGKESVKYQTIKLQIERDNYKESLKSKGILGNNLKILMGQFDSYKEQLAVIKEVREEEALRESRLKKIDQTVLGMSDQEYQRHLQMQAYVASRLAAPEEPVKHANKTNKAIKETIDLTRELTDAQKQQVAIADSVSGAFGDFFMGLVDGTTSAKDAFRSMATDIIQQLYRILVVEQLVQSIAGAITGGFAPASAAGTKGTVAPPRRPTGVFGNYDGGGYTGSGPRSGGLDGKGGFMAMLHPRETVVDHTKGQSAGGTVVNQVFNISANTSDDTKRLITQTIAQASPAIINQSVGAVMNQRRRGGAMKSAFG
jgi:hypothetical protein